MIVRSTALLALLALTVAVPAPAAPAAPAAPDHPLRLAQYTDPSMPLPPSQMRRRTLKREKPEVPPFALPTAPITTPGATPESLPPPGGAEFPPYEKELLRLAEVLGAVHYLNGLCGDPLDGTWRARMERLLEAEGAKTVWRERLIGSFNTGYRSFERSYRDCTPAAARATRIYLSEGQQLAGAMKAKYAN